MQVISFRNTVLFKRGMWASAAAMLAFVVLPPVIEGGFATHLAVNLAAGSAVAAFVFYFLRAIRIHRIADEVADCGSSLRVRKGRTEESVAFSQIAAIEATAGGGFHRITVRLRASGRIGREFDFLPPANLWGDAAAIRRAAANLARRIGPAA